MQQLLVNVFVDIFCDVELLLEYFVRFPVQLPVRSRGPRQKALNNVTIPHPFIFPQKSSSTRSSYPLSSATGAAAPPRTLSLGHRGARMPWPFRS